MSHPKSQHYVARLHLRRFAYETGKNPHIHAFDKVTKRAIRPSIKSVAAELHFYESTDGGIEKLLGKLENGFTPAYQRLREAARLDQMSTDDRCVVALFLAAQLIRTQEFRAQLKSLTSELDRWSKQWGHELDSSYTTITEEECRRIQASFIVNDVPRFAETMIQMKWIRLTNQTKLPFWTSDHPLNIHNPRPSDVRGNHGLKCRGVQLFFPLAPMQVLCLCDPIDYAAFPTDGVITDPENVVFHNNLQVRDSTRFVFSNLPDFSLAHEILNEWPEMADPNRLRLNAAGLD